MRKVTLLLVLLVSTLGYSQVNPIDFESGGNGANWTFSVFENNDNPPLNIIANPSSDAVNGSAMVAEFTARDSATGAQPFAGCITSDVGTFTLDATNSTVKIKVWKSVISDVGIKFETGTQASTGEIKVANTLTNQWEELTFDFSSKIGEPTSTDITGLIIFPDFATRAQDNVIYFDDIVFSEEITTPPSSSTINFDASAAWGGFMNVFELPENGGGYLFGSGWATSDLKTVIDTGSGTMTLQPNFNTYADNSTDPYWVNQTTMEGNKDMDATTNIADNSLVGTSFDFIGNVSSNTLDAAYNAYAFIRIFDGSFALLEEITSPLVAGSDFSVSYNNTQAGAVNIQYGFTVRGRNANPANEGALGSVVIQASTLGVSEFEKNEMDIFPNPSEDHWNVQSIQNINIVEVFDVLGKQVIVIEPNSKNVKINAFGLKSGMYFARVKTGLREQTIKLVKK